VRALKDAGHEVVIVARGTTRRPKGDRVTFVQADLSHAETVAKLMLKAALATNPSSIVLFSSKNPRHIEANVNTAADATLDQPARQLYTLVQSERDQLINITSAKR